MIRSLHNRFSSLLVLLLLLSSSFRLVAQSTTVFNSDFNTSAGASFSTSPGLIGTNSTWSLLRSGTDFGASITGGRLTITNNASGAINNSGWALAYSTAQSAPYSPILNLNSGLVTWTLNMRQNRSNPSGPGAGLYGNAFILAGSTNTTATTGVGYALVLGNNGKTDPLRLVRYTAGIRSSQNIITSNTSGMADWGNQYLSVKVTYNPSNGQWQLFIRNDNGIFIDPATGTLTSQGIVQETAAMGTSTGTSLPLIGAFWNAGTKSNQTAIFDNVRVAIATPAITSLAPGSKVAGTPAFTLTVNGTNFTTASTVRWNGLNRVTSFVSPTQLTASIPATDITTAGSVPITVATGSSISNSLSFVIDPANVPSISTSTTALNMFTTVTGIASASQNFNSTGTNLTGNITVTAPANFQVSLNNSTFTQSVSITAATTPVYIRVAASAAPGQYSNAVVLVSNGAANKQVAVSANVLSTEPTTSASGLIFSNTNSISTTLTWTNSSTATNHLVVVRELSAVTGAPVDGTTYPASANFGAGSTIDAGNYVVYNGTGNSVTITGLNPATLYHVSIFPYNGSAGTQNYRVFSPATVGNVTTANAPLGWQITSTNTPFRINFDTSVEGINNGAYDGAIFSSTPEVGELNSNGMVMTPYTTGAVNFGIDTVEDSPEYGNGVSEGGVTEGGIYAFEVAPGNNAFGFQPSLDGYGTGSTTIRMQNQTGVTITSLNIGYTTYVYNDEAGVQTYSFAYSATNSGTYTVEPLFTTSSSPGAEAAPAWKAHARVVTLSGLNIAPGGYYYIRFNNVNTSGTAFDEMALDDISVVANPSTVVNPAPQYVTFGGAIETFVIAGNAMLSGNATVNALLSFKNGKVLIGANTLSINGVVDNTAAGGLSGGNNSNIIIGGNTNRQLSFDQTTGGNVLNNLTINTSAANTTTLMNNVAVNGTLFTEAGQTLNLGTNTLTGTLATITNNGVVTTQNTTATPFASGKTWGGTGTVNLNAASASQTLVAGTYNNVTVSTTGGATTNADITVNGQLHLPNANPSATVGSLNTGSNTVFMGPLATNTGIGDVSGITTRNTGIVNNVTYTFGHPNTSILFPAVGTLPTSMSIKTTLGVAPSQKPDAILRTYDFIQTGGSATKAIIQSHYLDSELNGNTENQLVDWVVVVSPLQLVEQSRSNYSTTGNWVELGNVNVAFFGSSYGQKLLTMAKSQVTGSVWNGSVDSSWTTANNWTPAATPSDITKVTIPASTALAPVPNWPVLNPTVAINTLTIEAGAIVNNPTPGASLTITGGTGAWINNGTFNPGTGTVTFATAPVNGTIEQATIAGTTTFNNLTVTSGSILRALTDNNIKIGGVFTKAGSFVTGAVHSTVEYTGTNQTIVTPNGVGSSYHNLIISGTGAIVPATLVINGNLTTNNVVNFAGTAVTFAGVDTDDQLVNGTVSPVFNNLIVNKTVGQVMLASDATVSGTLTLTSGRLNIGAKTLTLGSATVSGTPSVTTMIVADGAGVVRRPYTATGSYLFPIGELTSDPRYSPITVDITSGTFSNGYVSVNVRDAVHPNNYSVEGSLSRYWNVTQTGITNAVATISGSYVAGDIEGTGTLAAAQLNGAFNVNTNPWIKFGNLSGTTLLAQNVVLTPGQTSAFTGITAASLTAVITGEGTFCQNEAVTLIAEVSAGDPPFTYSWSNGLGSASTATPNTATVGTTTYTLTVRDANGITATDTASVTITAPAVAGTLSASQTICEGVADAITLTGYSGNIIRWERSVNPEFSNPTFLSFTSATLSGAEMGNLNATRYFRAVVQSGSCGEVYSNAIVITVSSTTWNGTSWSAGVPTAGVAAIFTGNFTATSDIIACSIQVANGAIVSIPSGLDVTLEGRITVTSGSFTLEDNANLVQTTDVQNIGNIVVKQQSSSLYRLDYTMWSSPVASQNLFNFSTGTLSNRFFTYAVASPGVSEFMAVDPYANSFEAGKGYLIRMPNEIAGTEHLTYDAGNYAFSYQGVFTGVPNNGTITTAVPATGDKYSMVGNPYPSPINVKAFFDANTGGIDQTSALYFWRKRNNANATSYATITKEAYVSNQATGGGQEWFTFFNTTNPDSWVINPGQGFFIKAKEGVANPVIQFTNQMRRADAHNSQFFRTTQDNDTKSRYWLNLTGGDLFSQIAVVYTNTATLGIDYGSDGISMADGGLTLYTLAESAKLAIQARPAFTVSDVVPVGYNAEVSGTYTITLHLFDGVFETGQNIYLKDNLLNIFHDLKDSAYEFTTEAGANEERFQVVYTTETLGTNNPVVDANEIIVYKQDKTLQITSGTATMSNVTIFDIRGRIIYTAKDVNASAFTVNGLTAEEQVLIVNIATDKGTVSKKVIY